MEDKGYCLGVFVYLGMFLVSSIFDLSIPLLVSRFSFSVG